MAMIRQADLETSPRQALVLNVENIRAQADVIMDRTREAAASMVAEAKKTRDRILSGAAEAGHATGYAEGVARGVAEGRERGRVEARAEAAERLAKLEASWRAALEEFAIRRESLMGEFEQLGLDLAILIGQRVARRAIEVDRGAVTRQVAAILELASRGTRLVLSVNPLDLELVRQALPGLLSGLAGGTHAEVVGDPSVDAGSCVGRSEGGGVLDARVSTLIDSLVREMLPGEGPVAGGVSP